MIPAKITNLNPVQVTYTKLEHSVMIGSSYCIEVIAEVENVITIIKGNIPFFTDKNCDSHELSLNQQVLIEPTTEGKCRIIKLN